MSSARGAATVRPRRCAAPRIPAPLSRRHNVCLSKRRDPGPSVLRICIGRFTLATLTLLTLFLGAVWPCQAGATPEATRTEKIKLFDKLARAPELLVFGSSRAMRVDPALLRRLVSLNGFNAAVSSGTCADTWCFLHLAADRFPAAPAPRVLWVLDVEQFRARAIHPWLLSVPRLAQYVPPQFLPAPGAAARPPFAAGLADAADVAVGDHLPARATATGYGFGRVYDPNGFLRWAPQDCEAAHGWTLTDGISDSVEKYRGIYPRGFKAVGPMSGWFVRESIALLNQKGVRPVIVLSPYQPQLLRFIAGRGWPRRHQQVLDFFASLRPSCDFVLLDMTRLSSFGGRPSEFYDGTHGTVRLMNRLVRATVRRAAAALRPPAR